MKYRPEIDALRALAVISVVIFHFFPEVLPGGFLGVDIFFIISGYLITNNLIKLDNNNFKSVLKKFYSRRVKRLFPAFFVFLLITTLLLPFIFIKSDFEKYFSSLIAAKTFWANWFFWQDGGYFGGENDLKPLLHIWSLSVEEQFYLIYPSFILFCLWIYKKFNLNPIYQILLITIFSFILWIYLHSIGGSNPAFFLLPTRVWQFGLGGIIALLSNAEIFNKKFYRNSIFLAALFVIFFAINFKSFGFENKVVQVILVSFGAALFIYVNNIKKDKLTIFFVNPITIWLGKISYSIYLYHWPIAVLILYYYVDKNYIPIIVPITGIVLSIFLGFLSYKFIETPFKKLLNLRYTLILIIFCISSSFIVGKIVNNNQIKTLADILGEANGDHFRCSPTSYFFYKSLRGCVLHENKQSFVKNKIALIGNSHAQMYGGLFSKILKEQNQDGILIAYQTCLPTLTINLNEKCFKTARDTLEIISNDKNIKHVFIAMNWSHSSYIDVNGKKMGQDQFLKGLFDLTDHLIEIDKNVSIISPIPLPGLGLSNILPRMLKFKKISVNDLNEYFIIDRQQFDKKFGYINTKLIKKFGKDFIPVYEDLCDDDSCYFGNLEGLYFSDSHHLSQKTQLTKTDKIIRNKLHVLSTR